MNYLAHGSICATYVNIGWDLCLETMCADEIVKNRHVRHMSRNDDMLNFRPTINNIVLFQSDFGRYVDIPIKNRRPNLRGSNKPRGSNTYSMLDNIIRFVRCDAPSGSMKGYLWLSINALSFLYNESSTPEVAKLAL